MSLTAVLRLCSRFCLLDVFVLMIRSLHRLLNQHVIIKENCRWTIQA